MYLYGHYTFIWEKKLRIHILDISISVLKPDEEPSGLKLSAIIKIVFSVTVVMFGTILNAKAWD